MKKVMLSALWLLSAIWCVPATAVECADTPLTRLESTICGDAALSILDRELASSHARAQSGKLLDDAEIRRIRNGIARQCRRESDGVLTNCLLNAELDAYENVIAKLGEYKPSAQRNSSHSSNGVPDKTELLQRQLLIAQSSLTTTDDPRLTVFTMVELIDALQRRDGPTDPARTTNLWRRLAQGCHHHRYASKWKAAVQRNGLQCDELNRQFPLYSTSDYD